MKPYLIFLVLLLGAVSCKTQPQIQVTLIELKPLTTWSDKPIDTLLISYDKHYLIRNSDLLSHLFILTDRRSFNETVSYLIDKKPGYEASRTTPFEDGEVEANLYDNGVLVTSYLIKSHQLTKEYLGDLIKLLDQDNCDAGLIKKRRTLLTRINY